MGVDVRGINFVSDDSSAPTPQPRRPIILSRTSYLQLCMSVFYKPRSIQRPYTPWLHTWNRRMVSLLYDATGYKIDKGHSWNFCLKPFWKRKAFVKLRFATRIVLSLHTDPNMECVINHLKFNTLDALVFQITFESLRVVDGILLLGCSWI